MSDVAVRLRQVAPAALTGEPVAFAYLFGSHAAGTATDRSDIDVAIHPAAGSEIDRLALRLRLADVLERAAGIGPVEVVLLDEVPIALAGRVQEQHVLLHDVEPTLRVRYESRVAREFHDFKLHEDRMAAEALRTLSQGALMVDRPRVVALLQRVRVELDALAS